MKASFLLTLTVTSGYSFSGAFGNTLQIAGFSVNGIVPIWVSNDGTTLVFTVTFPMTAAPHVHTLVKTDAVAATCTTAGNYAYWTCSSCGKFYSDASGETEIYDGDWVITALGHNLVKTDAVAATCTTEGNSAYWTCSNCGKFYSDANGETEITDLDWIIPMLGHDWKTEWSNNETGHWHECSVCHDKKDEAPHDEGIWVTTLQPTATTTGTKELRCTVCGYVLETATIPATGGGTEIIYIVTAESSTWDGTGDYIITIQGTNKANFKDLKINGAALTEGVNYTAADGSVIITIKEAYLKTLATGSHNIVVEFKDGGHAYAAFEIENGKTTPDGFPIWAIALIAVAGLGVVGAGIWFVLRKKKTA